MIHRFVLDTNVLVSALRSRNGASFALLSRLAEDSKLRPQLSVPLVLEYEATLLAGVDELTIDVADIADLLDFICLTGEHHEIHYLWRPSLRDPKDEMVLELAVASGCERIVTFNHRDFRGAERFGVSLETPGQFLRRIGAAK
ncbi:MAG TPA: putative toxin-antitoxin system toxin component, PIN family [Vicinamibacterales bacterium]|nr:putative toxin-antitoxin system toxin component, PIN family [Vicinamibacterales bacterium]